jgi:hypothetical protein
MNVNKIVQQLRDKCSKLDAAIKALEDVGGEATLKRRGRPPVNSNQSIPAARPKRNRGMSAAARKRIAESMRKRWAAAKKSGKNRL